MANKVLFKGYKYDNDMSMVERMAHALDWAAKYHQGEAIPYNYLVKAIMGGTKTPRLKSDMVEIARKSMTRVREILRVIYNRGLVSVPGIGSRATVSDEDAAHNDLKPQARRFVLAGERLKKRADMINMSKIPKTKENLILLAWLEKSVRPFIKQIDAGILERLLPPVEGAKDGDNDKDKDKDKDKK